jgi:predicted dehydrogenase
VLRDDPRADLVAIAESDAARRERTSERFGVTAAFADWREMLDATKLDALVVATPPASHFAVAAAALERGIRVLVEKPMVVRPEDASRLVALSERHGAALSVGYTFHYTPHVIRLREEIAAGRIGRVEHVSCLFASTVRELYRSRPAAYADGDLGYAMSEVPQPDSYSQPGAGGGGQAHSQLTHSAALVLHLTGLAPVAVSAVTASFDLEVDLADALAIRFANGAVGALDSVGSVLSGQDEILQCRIFGDRGHVQLDAIQGTASIHGPNGETEYLEPLAAADRYPLHAPARALLGGGPSRAPGRLGADVVALLDAALRSAAEGRAVDVPRRAPTAE